MNTNAHFQKYDAIAKKIGVDSLVRIVDYILIPIYRNRKEKWEADKKSNPYLNHIDLRRWDFQHGAVHDMAVKAKAGWGKTKTAWALSDTICTLKHVAREYWDINERMKDV